jgi:hypothetical protein
MSLSIDFHFNSSGGYTGTIYIATRHSHGIYCKKDQSWAGQMLSLIKYTGATGSGIKSYRYATSLNLPNRQSVLVRGAPDTNDAAFRIHVLMSSSMPGFSIKYQRPVPVPITIRFNEFYPLSSYCTVISCRYRVVMVWKNTQKFSHYKYVPVVG